MDATDMKPPAVPVQSTEDAPVKEIKPEQLVQLGQNLKKQFERYANDRRAVEDKWIRNLRQYLGIYDPEIAKQFNENRSRAYPRITRVKCISVLSRIMNLMFPGNEKNWSLKASPSAEMSPEDVMMAVQQAAQAAQAKGEQFEATPDRVQKAVQRIADERAEELSRLIDDQLTELGGSQMMNYVSLNRKVADSGIKYGLGVLRGPFVKESTSTKWTLGEDGLPTPKETTVYKPEYQFLPVWDFYPDMSANNLMEDMDGYFIRLVMSKPQLRKLANRSDFFDKVIKAYIKANPEGDYKAKPFEQDLKAMGTKANVNDEMADRPSGNGKYEIVVWHGPVDAVTLENAGVEVPENNKADDVEAEIWLVGDRVIKADISPWYKLGIEMRTIHPFLFDEDDTSPVGNGLPNVVRDSQMSIAAATRMLLDNASIVCGPNVEINTDLMVPDQDITSISAYKVWYREGLGAEAQFPAIRNVAIDSHMGELLKTVELFMNFADMETFVGPATGGDISQTPSEPMRTAAGASMMRGDAALPFKDIVRSFDMFTESVIHSLVMFNKKFNPGRARAGDYHVVARGATSLIAKEVRGMQVDQLVATMTEREAVHVDDRKLVEARYSVRDLEDMLVPRDVAEERIAANAAKQTKLDQQQAELAAAELRKTLSDAFKNIAQGQKNSANADAAAINAAIAILDKGLTDEISTDGGAAAGAR